jgi:hypothetical protein
METTMPTWKHNPGHHTGQGISDKNDHLVAVVPDDRDDSWADALLISAAPDLLAALKAIVIECMDYPPVKPISSDSYIPPKMLAAAQAAITKALGK